MKCSTLFTILFALSHLVELACTKKGKKCKTKCTHIERLDFKLCMKVCIARKSVKKVEKRCKRKCKKFGSEPQREMCAKICINNLAISKKKPARKTAKKPVRKPAGTRRRNPARQPQKSPTVLPAPPSATSSANPTAPTPAPICGWNAVAATWTNKTSGNLNGIDFTMKAIFRNGARLDDSVDFGGSSYVINITNVTALQVDESRGKICVMR